MKKVNRALTVSGGNLKLKHNLNVTLDFSGVDDATVLDWATDNRIISLQRVLRAADDDYLHSLNGKLELHASACGGKIETPAERVAKLVRAGMPEKLAKLAVENPTKFAELIANVK